MIERVIGVNEAGQRFDKYLKKLLKEAPSSFIYKMLRKKNITLNEKKAEGKEYLEKADVVKLYFSDETFQKFAGKDNSKNSYGEGKLQCSLEPETVYEDQHICIYNKPVGVLSQKAKESDFSLNEYLVQYLLKTNQISERTLLTFRPSICNRLDCNTSGLIICGKTLTGLQKMNALIQSRKIRKFYQCLVKGMISESFQLEGYLKKDERTNKVICKKDKFADASYIFTKFSPISHWNDMTLLEVELITGKTHQIRAHLAYAGHPILGDYKYGDKKINDRLKHKYDLESQLLHASRLEFPSLDEPFTGISAKSVIGKRPAMFEQVMKGERK